MTSGKEPPQVYVRYHIEQVVSFEAIDPELFCRKKKYIKQFVSEDQQSLSSEVELDLEMMLKD